MTGIVTAIFLVYASALISLKFLKIKSDRFRYITRKSVHLTTGLFLFFLTYHFEKQIILMLILAGTLFSIITYKFSRFSFIHTTSGTSLGTLFYPIGLLASHLLLYNMPDNYFRITLMILTVSDTIANLCGAISTNKNFRFTIFSEEKSIFGAAGFAISTFILHMIFLPGQPEIYYIFLSVIAAVNFEIISARGSDNFSIPVGCSLYFLLTHDKSFSLMPLIILIPLLACGTVMLYKKNVLTRYGSIASYMLGVFLIALPGIAWITPVLVFFLTSVIFTKINGRMNRKQEDTNRRNIWQVFANIFFAVVSASLYLATENNIFIFFYITLVATVTADTWASEIGPVFSKRCFSISDFTLKDSGISGGVSLPGTAAALSGSFMISLLSYYLFFNNIDYTMIALLTLSGFAAVFADSFLSAFLEPVLLKMKFFKDKSDPDSPTPNDIVNLSASITAPIFFLLFRMIV
jgi:uncharacterized protein (TIGR00297 family)